MNINKPEFEVNHNGGFGAFLAASDGFDLVIVATKHYQAAQAIQQYLPGASGAMFLLFTANWDGLGEIDRLLPRSSILWGNAAAKSGYESVKDA